MSLDRHEARTLVTTSLRRIVPDADLASLGEDDDLRDAFELDSLDFLSFAEMLSKGLGRRIDEEDYPKLTTLAGCVSYLSATP